MDPNGLKSQFCLENVHDITPIDYEHSNEYSNRNRIEHAYIPTPEIKEFATSENSE